MTFKPKFTITNPMANDLTQIVSVKEVLDAAILSEDWISDMQSRALVLEAHHTTHIEGTRNVCVRFLGFVCVVGH